MKKIILISLLLLLVALGIWFFFIKKYDYQFRMDAKYGIGVVFYEIANWKNYTPNSVEEDIRIISKDSFNSLTQLVYSGDREDELEFHWEFEKENDTTTRLFLNVRSPHNKLRNRLSIINPFQKSIYVDTIKERIIAFKKRLNKKQDTYAVKLEDEVVQSPNLDCICHSSVNIPVSAKAIEMLNTISILEDYILQRDLKLTGNPFVKITKWNREKDIIDFDFCFPVNLAQEIKPTTKINFRQVKPFPALKAIFNGNYRNSHLAWYELINLATEKDKHTNSLPLEIFFNNPKVEATSAREWKAEIYLPVLE